MESRTRDVETVNRLRSARLSAVHSAQSSHLSEVFQLTDPSTAAVRVVKLLDVHPRLGKVVGRRLLDDLGINHFTCVGQLTSSQKRSILDAVGEL